MAGLNPFLAAAPIIGQGLGAIGGLFGARKQQRRAERALAAQADALEGLRERLLGRAEKAAQGGTAEAQLARGAATQRIGQARQRFLSQLRRRNQAQTPLGAAREQSFERQAQRTVFDPVIARILDQGGRERRALEGQAAGIGAQAAALRGQRPDIFGSALTETLAGLPSGIATGLLQRRFLTNPQDFPAFQGPSR